MATVEEIARDLVGSVASDAGALIAAKWIDNRYQELVSKVRFRNLRAIGELTIPATYDTGTITATRGSATITGVSTLWQTEFGAVDQEFLYFKGASAWYKIDAVASEVSLTLETEFAEDALAAGSSYVIVQRHHELASTARWISSFVHSRLRRPLDMISIDEMDALHPGRILTGTYPMEVAQVGFSSNDYVMVEFYPASNASEIIHYVYTKLPTSLTISSTIPTVVDHIFLKEGAYADLCRYEMAKALQKGQVNEAAVWRNEMRASLTKWKDYMHDVSRAQRSIDDISFVLKHYGGAYNLPRDIVSGRDIVLGRWSY